MTATTTGTTAGAREHARAQEADAVGTVATMPTRPARRFAHAAERGRPGHARARGGRRRRRLHAPRRRARHPRPADRPRRRRLRARPRLPAGPPVGAAERRGHRQGPVAGLPDGGPPAAQRPGPGAREHRRRHVRAGRTRCTGRRPGRATTSGTATAAPQGPTPAGPRAVRPGGGQARPGPTRPAAEHLVLPGRPDRRRRPPGVRGVRRRRARRSRCAPRCRCCCSSPTPRTRSTRASSRARRWRCSPGRARRPTDTDPLWDATPEGRRAFVNTHADLTARGIA